jgi:hypothetical protein
MGGSSLLGSPLAAFAAAKQRLALRTRSADGLIASSMHALQGTQQGIPAGWGAAHSAEARQQDERLVEAAAVVARGSQAVAALARSNTELRERLQSSLEVCRALRIQVKPAALRPPRCCRCRRAGALLPASRLLCTLP